MDATEAVQVVARALDAMNALQQALQEAQASAAQRYERMKRLEQENAELKEQVRVLDDQVRVLRQPTLRGVDERRHQLAAALQDVSARLRQLDQDVGAVLTNGIGGAAG